MIGQEQFLEKINKYTLQTLPHSILLLGEHGAGQYEVCELLAANLNVDLIDATDLITHEYIELIQTAPNVSIYAFDISKLTVKDQNLVLKIFEEPNKLTYIILYGDSIASIIPTIINRSYILQMDNYSRAQLEPLAQGDVEYILQVCSTPGQIEVANRTDLPALCTLCQTILSKIGKASLSNLLTVADKINFKDEYSKFDLYLFTQVLLYEMLQSNDFQFFDELDHFKKYVYFMTDKKRYFENFLIQMWEKANGL